MESPPGSFYAGGGGKVTGGGQEPGFAGALTTPYPLLSPPPSLPPGEKGNEEALKLSWTNLSLFSRRAGGRRGEEGRGDEGLLRRRLPRALFAEAAPGLLAVVEDGQVGHAAAGGVDVPAPEEGPLEVGAVRLQHAEDQAVHAVEDAELEDVGA